MPKKQKGASRCSQKHINHIKQHCGYNIYKNQTGDKRGKIISIPLNFKNSKNITYILKTLFHIVKLLF